MEKLLQMARKRFDSAEVFFNESHNCRLDIANGTVKGLEGGIKSGYALRGIKKNMLGTSYINNLENREMAVEGAAASLTGKVQAKFDFPEASKVPKVESYDARVESMTYTDLYETGKEIMSHLDGKVKGQLNLYMGFRTERRRIINTNGMERANRNSYAYAIVNMVYPKTSYGLGRIFAHAGPEKVRKKDLQEHLDDYNATIPVLDVETGRYPVIFMPDGLFPILWRISEGANGKNIFEKTSPLAKKLGKRVFPDMVNIFNDPRDRKQLSISAFDDEGVPTRKLEIIRNGIFKSCYVDLDHAAGLKIKPTGNGFRTRMFMSGNPIKVRPAPVLTHISVMPGKDRFKDMLGSIQKGIIVEGVIGPHSGNILNGDFSVGLAPGFLVKKGEIVGRVKSGLISGNIYDLLQNLAGIEDRNHYPEDFNTNPSMLIDDVKVSGK